MKIRPVSLAPSASELMCRITAPSEVSNTVYHFSSNSPMPDGNKAGLKVFAPSFDTMRLTVCAVSSFTFATRMNWPDTKNLFPNFTDSTGLPFGVPLLLKSMYLKSTSVVHNDNLPWSPLFVWYAVKYTRFAWPASALPQLNCTTYSAICKKFLPKSLVTINRCTQGFFSSSASSSSSSVPLSTFLTLSALQSPDHQETSAQVRSVGCDIQLCNPWCLPHALLHVFPESSVT
mmetsp:Transcript_61382/g.155025  ORF Transcript_61382/g.155025 Transcript_61382/m.155025 type:complete len:232 (+) Transcript_61382:2011-2706(+)